MTADKLRKTNWAVFEKRYGANISGEVKAGQQETIEILSSRKGVPTVRVTTPENKQIFLHSSVDPIREAEKIADGIEALPGNFVVVYGLGLGYLIEALLEKLDEKIPLFVIEPDPVLFGVVMSTRDLRTILSSKRVFLIVHGAADNNLIGTYFFSFYDSTRYSRMVLTGLSGHKSAYNDDYRKTIRQLHDAVKSKMVNLNTMRKIGRDLMSNAIINLPTLYTSPGIKTLFGRFKDMPAIVVSAGPSLNRNIHLLKQAQGKAVILAVGTAVKALQKNGVDPDFMVSIDPDRLNYGHFKGVNTKHSALITEMQSHPEILEKFSGPIFVSGNSPILKWFDDVIEEKGIMESGGSVANNAMTAAYKMGANPIVFVGQDLAYAKDGHSHAAGTNYENKVYTGGESSDYFFVKANDGGEVLTDSSFYQFLNFFQNWIKNYPQPEYINATEGGALIEGTKIMTLQEVLDRYCVKSIDVQKIIKEVTETFKVQDFAPFLERLEERLTDLNNMLKEANLAIRRLEQLEQACKTKNAKNMNRCAKNVKQSYKKFEKNIDIRDVVEWFTHNDLQQVFYRTNQAEFKEADDYHAAIADYKLYYEKIIDGVKVAQGLVEGCVTKIRGKVNDGCKSV